MTTPVRAVLALAALAAAGAVLAAGLGAATTSKTTVALRKTALGRVLVDGRGRTLYLFEADTGTTSACTGRCAAFWPPVLVKGKPTAGKGLRSSLLGVSMRKGGAHQLVYAGHPLYRFALDKKAGQTKGQGLDDFGGHWHVVGANGREIDRDAPAAATTTPTQTTPEPGYGGGY